MTYINSILWLVAWPVFIIFAFQIIKYLLKKIKYL